MLLQIYYPQHTTLPRHQAKKRIKTTHHTNMGDSLQVLIYLVKEKFRLLRIYCQKYN